MRWLVRFSSACLVTSVALVPALADAASPKEFNEAPISVATIVAAELYDRLKPATTSTWNSLDGSPNAEGPNLQITGQAAIVVQSGDMADWISSFKKEYEIQTAPQALRGPHGTLYGQPGVTILNSGNPDYYVGLTVGTALMVEVGCTDAGHRCKDLLDNYGSSATRSDFTGIFETSFAFTYTGDAVLVDSPFGSNDPLIGYGNATSRGLFDGTKFAGFSKFNGNMWDQFPEQVLAFSFSAPSTTDGASTGATDYYLVVVVPSVPESAAFTLTYAEEPEIETSVNWQVVYDAFNTGPAVSLDFSKGATYGDIDPDVAEQTRLFSEITNVRTRPEIEPDERVPETTSSTTATTLTVSAPESNAASTVDTDSASSVAAWLIAIGGLALVIGLLLWWTILIARRRRGTTGVQIKDMDGSFSGGTPDVETVEQLHLEEGGSPPVDGWIAPSNLTIIWAGVTESNSPNSPAGAWSERFLNVETGEMVERGQDGFDELIDKLGISPPPEWGESTGTDGPSETDPDTPIA